MVKNRKRNKEGTRGMRSKPFLKLKGRIVELGYTQGEIADKLGITLPRFNEKLNGKTDFWLSEIFELATLLDIPTDQYYDYFFTPLVR